VSPRSHTLVSMDRAYLLRDCPECHGIRTVILDVCYVCFAEFGEGRDWFEDDVAIPASGRIPA